MMILASTRSDVTEDLITQKKDPDALAEAVDLPWWGVGVKN